MRPTTIVRVIEHKRTDFTSDFTQGKSTGMVVFDGEKALDTVWQNGLLQKMLQLKFPMYLLKLITSMTSGQTYEVRVGNSTKG